MWATLFEISVFIRNHKLLCWTVVQTMLEKIIGVRIMNNISFYRSYRYVQNSVHWSKETICSKKACERTIFLQYFFVMCYLGLRPLTFSGMRNLPYILIVLEIDDSGRWMHLTWRTKLGSKYRYNWWVNCFIESICYIALRSQSCPLLGDAERTENFKIDHFDEKNRPFLHIFVSARSRS